MDTKKSIVKVNGNSDVQVYAANKKVKKITRILPKQIAKVNSKNASRKIEASVVKRKLARQFFPNQAKLCAWKWNWSTIFLTLGTTTSCHRCDHQKLTLENFDRFHNLEKKVSDRKLMIEGRWPKAADPSDLTGCTYCRKIEEAGGFSDRNVSLQMQGLVPKELYFGDMKTEVTPTILEIYFSNKCNLSCLYCNARFSSKWELENSKFLVDRVVPNDLRFSVEPSEFDFAQLKPDKFNNPDYFKMKDKLFSWIKENGKHLSNLQILGGEPFFQEEFDQLLELLENHPCPNLSFVTISNLMIEHNRFKEKLERVSRLIDSKKLKGMRVTASIDGWGKEQEFVRSGLSLKVWEKNFDFAAKQPWIDLHINSAINPLTIKTLPELIRLINEKRKFKNIGMSFMTVVYPTEMNPDIFGPGVFEKDFERVVDLMPLDNKESESYRNHMIGIARQISGAQRNDLQILRLATYLSEMDRRRSTSWKELFPWLVEEVEISKLNLEAKRG